MKVNDITVETYSFSTLLTQARKVVDSGMMWQFTSHYRGFSNSPTGCGLQVYITVRDDAFTAEQISQLKEAFYRFDKDKDGVIRFSDLRSVMRVLGLNPTEKEILDIMNALDVDGNGKIELAEFIAIMLQKMQTTDTEAEIRQAFKVFDRDGNGFLSAEELKYMMLAALGHQVTDEEVDEMLKEADIDGDGRINYQEFVQMLMSD